MRSLIADAHTLGIARFVKQLGSAHSPHKGGDMDTWPADLRVREYPTPHPALGQLLGGGPTR